MSQKLRIDRATLNLVEIHMAIHLLLMLIHSMAVRFFQIPLNAAFGVRYLSLQDIFSL